MGRGPRDRQRSRPVAGGRGGSGAAPWRSHSRSTTAGGARSAGGGSVPWRTVDVLSSRLLMHPSAFEDAVAWYRDVLGLHVYREYGAPARVAGGVFLLAA